MQQSGQLQLHAYCKFYPRYLLHASSGDCMVFPFNRGLVLKGLKRVTPATLTAFNVRSKGIPGLATTGHDCSAYSQDVSPTARIALAESLPRAVRRLLPLGESG